MDKRVIAHGKAPLTRKLAHFAPLTEADRETLDDLVSSDEQLAADTDIVSEGQVPRSVFVLHEGIACRYRILGDGRRQIMTFLLPGDLCDLHVFLLKAMDHSIGTLTPVRLAKIARDKVMDIAFRHPRISAALWWSTMQEEAMLRERIVALGRRNAAGRIAYLLCELLWRHKAVGLASDNDSIQLPLTQTELADTLGLTPVHVNRVLQDLRRQGLITLTQRVLRLLDVDRLQKIAEFNASYLHLGGAPAEISRYFDELEQRRGETVRKGNRAGG